MIKQQNEICSCCKGEKYIVIFIHYTKLDFCLEGAVTYENKIPCPLCSSKETNAIFRAFI